MKFLKSEKRIVTYKDRCRYSRKREKLCRNFDNFATFFASADRLCLVRRLLQRTYPVLHLGAGEVGHRAARWKRRPIEHDDRFAQRHDDPFFSPPLQGSVEELEFMLLISRRLLCGQRVGRSLSTGASRSPVPALRSPASPTEMLLSMKC